MLFYDFGNVVLAYAIFNFLFDIGIKEIFVEISIVVAHDGVNTFAIAKPNTPQGDELELLMLVVEAYEKEHCQIPVPTAIEAIKFRMEQNGLLQKDLVDIIGDKAVVSKVLSGERGLTLGMVKI